MTTYSLVAKNTSHDVERVLTITDTLTQAARIATERPDLNAGQAIVLGAQQTLSHYHRSRSLHGMDAEYLTTGAFGEVLRYLGEFTATVDSHPLGQWYDLVHDATFIADLTSRVGLSSAAMLNQAAEATAAKSENRISLDARRADFAVTVLERAAVLFAEHPTLSYWETKAEYTQSGTDGAPELIITAAQEVLNPLSTQVRTDLAEYEDDTTFFYLQLRNLGAWMPWDGLKSYVDAAAAPNTKTDYWRDALESAMSGEDPLSGVTTLLDKAVLIGKREAGVLRTLALVPMTTRDVTPYAAPPSAADVAFEIV